MQYTQDAILTHQPVKGARGWHIHAKNDVVGDAFEIVARSMSYAQLAAEETLEVLSAQAADTTQKLTIFGINDSGKQYQETVSLNGTTVVNTTGTFRYVENAVLDKEAAGAITIRKKTGDTLIMTIAVGSIESQICQHFNGEKKSYVTMFSAQLESLDNDCLVELRWYPDDADCLDAGDGFKVLDRIPLYVTEGPNPAPHVYPQHILVPAGGWLSVYAKGAAASAVVSATIQGYDEV